MNSKASHHVFALDLGGSKISGAIVDSELTSVFQKTVPSRQTSFGIADPGLSQTKSLIAELREQAEKRGLDVAYGVAGFPEYVNLDGMLTTADNIDWQVQPQEDFSQLTGIPWMAQSDVRCAGIAEARKGAGRDLDDFVYVTVSSGISHTHFLNGQAVTGSSGEAIGFGVTDLEISGQIYPLENYCSGLGMARRYAQFAGDFTSDAKALVERFDNDEMAREIIISACAVLGTELAELAKQLSTEVIVIGGGLWLGSSKYRDLTMKSFSDACQKFGISASIRSAEVEHSGVIGAAIYGLAALASER